MEENFAYDHVRRNKRFVRYTSFLVPLVMMVFSYLKKRDTNGFFFDGITSVCPVLLLQVFLLWTFTDAFYKYFQVFQL